MDPRIAYIETTISDSDLEGGANYILQHIRPTWTAEKEKVQFKLFTDGITNKLVGCFHEDFPEDGILVRVYGKKTDLLIDRELETKNFKFLQKAGIAPNLYAVFNNGIAYEFVAGCTLTTETCKDPNVYPLVAESMANFHKLSHDAETPKVPSLWKKFQQFIDLVPDVYENPDTQKRFQELFPKGKSEIIDEISSIESIVKRNCCSPIVFCHNDLLLANILVVGDNERVTFIDYEYADYNYQAFDIGNHFAEFAGVSQIDFSRCPDKDFQKKWLRCYLEAYTNDKVSDNDIEKLQDQVEMFCSVAHLVWAVWALVQGRLSTIDFDFISYAGLKYQEYLKRKEEYLSS